MENIKTQNDIFQQSIKEYQVIFLYRPEDDNYWNEKKDKGLTHCYIKNDGKLIPWEGESILKSFNEVTLNIKDDTFDSKFKKMRVAKRAPNYWRFYYTTERIVTTIPYGKTLKIGDVAELFKNTIKRKIHKNQYIVTCLPHSMLAGIVLRSQAGKSKCEHIAFVYKNTLKSQNRIVNYTLYFFNYGDSIQSEKFCIKVKNQACNLQLKLLPMAKEKKLISNIDMELIRSEVSKNLKNNKFETRTRREKFRDFTIKTLYVGGIPYPIFPRSSSNIPTFQSSYRDKYHRYS